jgi:surface protein
VEFIEPAVATVLANGLVTAISVGSTTVLAKSGSVSAMASVTVATFYLAANGVTVICSAADVGDTGEVGGVTYTKRSKAQIDALVDAEVYAHLTTTCTSGVTDMKQLFYYATSFNGDISSWDVSSVTTMYRMFSGASSFNQDISSWNVSSVTTMSYMFYTARAFNQTLNSWVVSSVTTMNSMFRNATAFNGDISSWNVSSVTDMDIMFRNATAFNQDIGSWNVSSVTTMSEMFYTARAFNQDLSGWCVSLITNEPAYFDAAATSWIGGTPRNRPVWGTCPS